ncbi:unnamed protein product [Rhizopus microsporus]
MLRSNIRGSLGLSSHAEQMPEEINELSVALPEPEPNNISLLPPADVPSSPIITPSSEGTSFVTARSKNTALSPQQLSPFDEIDYNVLNTTIPPIDTIRDQTKTLVEDEDDAISVATVKPEKRLPTLPPTPGLALPTIALSSETAKSLPPIVKKKLKQKRRRTRNKTLKWKKAGTLFVPSTQPIQSERSTAMSAVLKRGLVICMRKVTDRIGSEPTRYRASKESKFDLLAENWTQVELVLTRSCITTYSFSTYFWPNHRLEHRIYFQGPNKPRDLELFLFSPLDYTFGLRFSSMAGKTPTTVSMMFKANTFLQCQEWYTQLYKVLPKGAKRPFPSYCEVYIPAMNLTLNLPLEETQGCYDITLADIKEAVMTVVEESGYDGKLFCLDDDEIGVCWATEERVEWVYWTASPANPDKRIDLAVCPQSIEQTHRLELRAIEHTPDHIILDQNDILNEPCPMEGFLVCASDFFGLTAKVTGKMYYFASFDQYLVYIPSTKATKPHTENIVNHESLGEHVWFISPYTSKAKSQSEMEEIKRRMRLLSEAKGLIDLTEVSYVKRHFIEEHDDIGYESHISHEPLLGGSRLLLRKNLPCILEFVMENGLQIQFQTYSQHTCDIWVNHLSQLIIYWKAQKEARRTIHLNDHFGDLVCSEKERSENHMRGREIRIADTRIWSYCLYERCHDVVKTGILYYKPHHRETFSQKIFILSANGWLLFFDVFNRNSTKKSGNHERKGAMDIAGSYFFSGVDSSKTKKGSNSNEENTVKVYSDGLTTDDDQLTRIFSIWKPTLRRYFSPKRQRLRVYRQDQQLTSKGETVTFLAESRQEKEEWICALNSVAEHLQSYVTKHN